MINVDIHKVKNYRIESKVWTALGEDKPYIVTKLLIETTKGTSCITLFGTTEEDER